MGMDLSAYSMMQGYLPNMNGGMVPAKTNMAMYQPAYTVQQQNTESIEQLIERKIREGITASWRKIEEDTKERTERRNNNVSCYKCGKRGHFARDCRQGNTQNNNNNNNRNNNGNRNAAIQCYNCGRTGHISRNCRAPSQQNNQGNRFNNNNQAFQNNNGNRSAGQNNNNRSLN